MDNLSGAPAHTLQIQFQRLLLLSLPFFEEASSEGSPGHHPNLWHYQGLTAFPLDQRVVERS